MAKLAAVFFILLLAGHEAARVNEATGLGVSNDDDLSGAFHQDPHVRAYYNQAELDFQEANKQCVWRTSTFGCDAAGGKCTRRALPMDWPAPSSESCRLTDDYMLKPATRAKFFKMASGVLSAKSRKFSEKCKGSSLFYMTANRKCARRAKQMMRAMKVMSKAQTVEMVASLSEEEKALEKAMFEESLNNLADATGEDGPMVLELQQKLKANVAGVKRDPKGSVNSVIAILQKLLKGTDAEKEEARAEIRAMKGPGEVEQLGAEEAAELDRKNAELASQLDHETSVTELVDNVDTVAPDNDDPRDGNASLVEVARSDAVVSGIAFVLTVMLVIFVVIWAVAEVVAALVLWAFISLLGCGLYAIGHDSALSSAEESRGGGQIAGQPQRVGFFGTAKCFFKAFALPFIIVGTAAVATYRFFWGVRREPGVSYLQLGEPTPGFAGNFTAPAEEPHEKDTAVETLHAMRSA